MAEERVVWRRGRVLGKGGFGLVSLASTSSYSVVGRVHLPPLIAVKSCIYSRSRSLQEESEILGLFHRSPHIIQCFGVDVTEEDGLLLYNLLLEYASAGSLADYCVNRGKGGLPEPQVRKHTKNVLLGLTHVHAKEIVHCDIKPQNILLVVDGTEEEEVVAKIADFGLAMTFEQSRNAKHGLRGTKRYMAPESVANREYGPEVDIWALGCTVYELIAGTPLWEESDDEFDVLGRIEFEDPKFENAALSREAQDFVRRCLVKNPSSRWTADMLLNHPFLKSADDNVKPPAAKAATRKKQRGYMSLLRKPHQKRAFKTQPHIRDLIL